MKSRAELTKEERDAWRAYAADSVDLPIKRLRVLAEIVPTLIDDLDAKDDIIDAYASQAIALKTRIAEAEALIARGVQLMPINKLAQWEGVRAWQEAVS